MTHELRSFASPTDQPNLVRPDPDRRQVLNGFGALMASAALPIATATAIYVARPGGWILRESDRDVS